MIIEYRPSIGGGVFLPRPFLLVLCLFVLPLTARAETVLLMAEKEGCFWCIRWHDEVGPIYPKTDEGRAAPLLRHDLAAPLPDGIELNSRVRFTPTFILLEDGHEVARIEGYPGDMFFWALLNDMLTGAGVVAATGG